MHYRNRHRFHKRDRNHDAIAKALRQCGAKVIDLSHVGDGCPDLLVGFRGQLVMLEIKMDKGTLTSAEATFHDEWEGHPVAVVHNVAEAIGVIGALE
jgi:hypothetical protein